MVKMPSMVVLGTDSEQLIKVKSPKANKIALTFLTTLKTWEDCQIAMQRGTDFQ